MFNETRHQIRQATSEITDTMRSVVTLAVLALALGLVSLAALIFGK